MDKFFALHFEKDSVSDITPPNSVVCIPSNETMECLSSASVEDLDGLSDPEDQNVAMLA